MSLDPNNQNPLPDHPEAIKIVTLEPGSTFHANGRLYKVSDSFTIGRLERITVIEEELLLLGDQASCHQVILRAMEHINNYKPGEAYTLLYNKVESDRKNPKLLHYAVRACTAYINYEGEDLGYLTEEQIREKINDWSAEGLDVRPFIIFAATVFQQHLAPYRQDMENILTEVRRISAHPDTEKVTPGSTESPGNGDRK